MNIDIKEIQKSFEKHFGQTSLRQRNDDILKEAIELSRFTSIQNLKEKHGDLLCSLLMSFVENDLDPSKCIQSTLEKINRRTKQYQAYGRKLSVAIIGGAFDPITNGHTQVGEFLLNCSSMFDMIWYMPCYKHMYNKKMESAEHRLEIKLATRHDRRMFVSDYEIKKQLGGETYLLAKCLMSEDFVNKYDFSFVIGADNANTFDKWINFEELEKTVKFVVVPRNGVDLDLKHNWYMKPPHALLIPEKPLSNISSTIIRNQVKTLCADAFLKENLNLDVFDYIMKNKLYMD